MRSFFFKGLSFFIMSCSGLSLSAVMLPELSRQTKVLLKDNYDAAEKDFAEGRYQDAIELWSEPYFSQGDDQQKSELLLRVAVAWEKDQEEEKAIEAFLESLRLVESHGQKDVMSKEEAVLYDEGLEKYLQDHLQKKRDHTLYVRYLPYVEAHREYYHLNYLVAARAASLGLMDEFYVRFYHSYSHLPDTYLSYRCLGILRLVLWEKVSSPQRKQTLKEEIVTCFEKALEFNPQDSSLYLLIVKLSDPENKKQVINQYIKQMVDKSILMPRGDIYPLVEECTRIGNYQMAQDLITLAKKHYSYSKAINAAQAYLDQEKLKRNS